MDTGETGTYVCVCVCVHVCVHVRVHVRVHVCVITHTLHVYYLCMLYKCIMLLRGRN